MYSTGLLSRVFNRDLCPPPDTEMCGFEFLIFFSVGEVIYTTPCERGRGEEKNVDENAAIEGLDWTTFSIHVGRHSVPLGWWVDRD